MIKHKILHNNFLKTSVDAYYRFNYTGFGSENNPDFLNYLKNQFGDTSKKVLENSVETLKRILIADLTEIQNKYEDSDLFVCVVPRAKNERSYSSDQKLFKKTVSEIIYEIRGLENGANTISRHTNTITTHMHRSGRGGDGELPYPGITTDTCYFFDHLTDKNILLIDDIYTKSVNIDEDVIQALYDNGAKNVIFYSVAKTLLRNY